MGSEYRRLGYLAGVKTAHDLRKEVRKSHKDDLPDMAGVKMQILVKESMNPIYLQESWQEGFWSGFMDKAEDMRG